MHAGPPLASPVVVVVVVASRRGPDANEANLNLLILGSVAVVQARVKTGMLLSLSNKLFGRDEVDDASSSGTAARLTALSSVPVTSMVIDDGLLTDFPASSSPDDDLPRWLTGDCAVPRLARDIFALILAPDSCDPDSRTGKPSSEVALACHLVKSGLPLLSSSFLRPTYYAVSQSNRECLRRREIKARLSNMFLAHSSKRSEEERK